MDIFKQRVVAAILCVTGLLAPRPHVPVSDLSVLRSGEYAPLKNTAAQSPLPDESISIAAVGDIMIGSTYPDESRLPPEDGRRLLRDFTPVLRSADITFGNLEGPLLDSGVSSKCPALTPGAKPNCYAFRVPTRYGHYLKEAGFSVVSLANNHAGDFGDAGRASSRGVMDELGIRHVGSDRFQFATIVLVIKGKRVGFVGFAHNEVVPNVNDLDAARKIVADLKRRSDIVVVSFHGGAEGVTHQHVPMRTEIFYGESRGNLPAFTHAVIDAGADLVLGHGPHVLRGMEVYKGRLIAYSLGNFCTYGWFTLSGETALTAVFDIRLNADGTFLGGQLHPGVQGEPGGPVPDLTGSAIRVVRSLSESDFGDAAPRIEDNGAFSPRVSAQ